MKPRPSIKLLILAGSLSIAAPALHAQSPIEPGAQSNVTLTLTASYTEDNEDKYSGSNIIYSSRIVKVAYGNKQLIADMYDAGDLPDSTVSGWKLVLVNRSPEYKQSDRSFYLVKAGKTPVPVPYLSISGGSGFAESYTYTENYYDKSYTGKSTFRSQFSLKGYLLGENYTEFRAVGLLTGSDRSGPVKISNEPFTFIYQFVSAKLSGIVGSTNTDYEVEDLIEGSVSFSADVPVNISGYPAPIE
jgi:hypothetical protein